MLKVWSFSQSCSLLLFGFFALALNTPLVVMAQALMLTESQPYSKIQQQLKTQINETSDSIYSKLDESYKDSCLKEKKNYKAFGKTINCNINIRSLLRGKKQVLLNGELKEGDLGNFSGAKVELTKGVKVRAEIEPILKNYKIPVLDHKRELALEKQSVLHKNLYIKHEPQNTALYTTACVELPGYKIKTEVSDIKAKAKKKVFWFVSLSAKIKVKMDLGEYKMEAAKICGAAKTVVKDIDLSNYQSISQLQKAITTEQVFLATPKMTGITQSGLKVKKVDVDGNNFITKIIFAIVPQVKKSVVKQVKASIEKDIKKQTQALVKVTNNNITSGKLWDQLAKQLAVASSVEFTKNLNASINKSIRENTKENIVIDNQTIGKACDVILEEVSNTSSIEISSKKCKVLVDKFEIVPFAKNKEMENLGCYDYYYSPNDNYSFANDKEKNHWWKEQCGLTSSVKIYPKAEYAGSAECLANAISLKWSVAKTVMECGSVVLTEHLKISASQLQNLQKSKSVSDLKKTFTDSQIKKLQTQVVLKGF